MCFFNTDKLDGDDSLHRHRRMSFGKTLNIIYKSLKNKTKTK